MLKLAMTPSRPRQIPTIFFKQLDDLLNFHASIIICFLGQRKTPHARINPPREHKAFDMREQDNDERNVIERSGSMSCEARRGLNGDSLF